MRKGSLEFQNRKGFIAHQSHFSILVEVARESNRERFFQSLRQWAIYHGETRNIIYLGKKTSPHKIYMDMRKPNVLGLHSVHEWVKRQRKWHRKH